MDTVDSEETNGIQEKKDKDTIKSRRLELQKRKAIEIICRF
jgi:hypothetical protein